MMEYDNRDSGALFKNDKKGNEKAPDYTGEYTTPDNQKRRVAAWLRKSKSGQTYLSLKFSDMQKTYEQKQVEGLDKPSGSNQGQAENTPYAADDGFDEIPF